MYKNIEFEDTNKSTNITDKFKELSEMFIPQKNNVILATQSMDFKEQFIDTLKQNPKLHKPYLSHTESVFKTMESVCQSLFQHDEFLQVMLDPNFASSVIQELSTTKSYAYRKHILRKIYHYFRDQIILHPLDPKLSALSFLLGPIQSDRDPYRKHLNDDDFHPLTMAFVNYLTEKEFKWQKTARIHTTLFLKWLCQNDILQCPHFKDINVKQIKPEHLEAYRKYLENELLFKKISSITAQSHIQSLKGWFHFLKLNGYIIANPAQRLRNFKVHKPKHPEKLMPLEKAERIFEVILKQPDALKYFSAYAMIAAHGLRVCELAGIRRCDIDLENNLFTITRKGGDQQSLPFENLTWLSVKLYLESIPNEPLSAVWLNTIGKPLSEKSLRYHFHKFSRMAGVTENYGACHLFRHLLLSELANKNEDLEAIRELAGHDSINILSFYIHSRRLDVKNKVISNFKTLGVDNYVRSN